MKNIDLKFLGGKDVSFVIKKADELFKENLEGKKISGVSMYRLLFLAAQTLFNLMLYLIDLSFYHFA